MGGQQLLFTAGLAAAATAAAAAALVSPQIFHNMSSYTANSEQLSCLKQHADGDVQQQDSADEEAPDNWAQAFLMNLSAQETAAQLVLSQQWKRCMQSMLPLAAAAAVSERSCVVEGHGAATTPDESQSHPAAAQLLSTGGRGSCSCNSRASVVASLGGRSPAASRAGISQTPEQQGAETVQVSCKHAAPQPMIPVALTPSDSPASLHSQETPVRSAASFFLGSQRQQPGQALKQECQATVLDHSAVGDCPLLNSEQPGASKCAGQQSCINSKAAKLWRQHSSEGGSLLGSERNSRTGHSESAGKALLQLCSTSSANAEAAANSSLSIGAATHGSELALSSDCTTDTVAQTLHSQLLESTQQQQQCQHKLDQFSQQQQQCQYKLDQCSQQQQQQLILMPHCCDIQQLEHLSGQLSQVEELSDKLQQKCSSLVAEKKGLDAALQLARAQPQQVEVWHDDCLRKLSQAQQQLEQQRDSASGHGVQRLQQLLQQVQTKLQQVARLQTPLSSNSGSCTVTANAQSSCTQSAELQLSQGNVALQQSAQEAGQANAVAQASKTEQDNSNECPWYVVVQLESCIHQLLDQWDQELAPMAVLQQQVQQLSGELQQATQIAETAVFDKQQLQRAKSVLQRKLSESQQQLLKQQKALTEVTNDRMVIAAASSNLHHQVQGLQDINKQLHDAARRAQDASAAQEQKVQQLQQQVGESCAAEAAAASKRQEAEQALKLAQSECDNGLYQVAQLHLKLQEAKVEHRREIARMQKQVDALMAENFLQSQQLQEEPLREPYLQGQLGSAHAAKEHAAQLALAAEQHAQQLQQELATLQAAYAESLQEAVQLQQELTAVRAAQESSSQTPTTQQEQLQQELTEALAARDNATADALQLKQRHAELTADLAGMHQELSLAKAAYRGSTQAAVQLLQQLQLSAELVEQLQQLTTHVLKLEEDLAAATTAYHSSTAEAVLLKKQLAESAAALSNLQQELLAVAAVQDCNAAEADLLKQQLQQSVMDIQRLQLELTAAQVDREQISAAAVSSAAQIQQLQQELKEVTAGHAGLELEAKTLRQHVRQLQLSATDASQLRQELHAAQQAHECAATQVAQLQQKLEQSAADKWQVQEELSAVRAAADRAAQDVHELQEHLQQAKADVHKLQQELAAATAAADAVHQQTTVVQLQQQLVEAAYEVKQLQLELSAAKRARDGALTEVSQLQQQLQSTTANTKQLKQQLAAVQSGKELLDQVSQLQRHVTKLTQQHEEATACSSSLQAQLQQAQSELKALQDERDLESSQLIAALGAAQTRIAGSTQQVAEAQHDVTQLARVVELQQQQLAWQQDTIRRLKSVLPQPQLQVLLPEGDDTPWSSACTSPRTISPGPSSSRGASPFRQPSRPTTPYMQQQQQADVMPTLTVVSATCELPATAGVASRQDLCLRQEARSGPRTKTISPVPCAGTASSPIAHSSSSSSSSATRNVANRRASVVQTAGSDACRLPTGQAQHITAVPCTNSVRAASPPAGSLEPAGAANKAAASDPPDTPNPSSKALTPSNTVSSKSKRNSRRVSSAGSSGGGAIVLPQQKIQAAPPRRTSSSSSIRKQGAKGAAVAAPASTSCAAAGSRLLQDSLLDSYDSKLQLSVSLTALATGNSRPSSGGAAAADVSSSSSSSTAVSLEGAVLMDHKCGWLWAAGTGSSSSSSDMQRGGLEGLSAEFSKMHDLSAVAGVGSLSVGGWGQPGSDAGM